MTALPLVPIALLWLSLADAEYTRGMVLAREQRWEEARQAFETGWKQAPRDKRFPLQLAGIAYKQSDRGAARARLHDALRLDPADDYANDFLATLYLLDENLEAALKYWNRAGGPRIERISMTPRPDLDPVLLDRAFAFAPTEMLHLEHYRTTRERLRHLEAFRTWRFELLPREDDAFDLTFRPLQRRAGWLSAARGLPFQTVHPEFYNLGRSATHVVSLLRWDAQKRRAFASFSAPAERDPAWRYRLWFDGRQENWNLPDFAAFRMEKLEGGVTFDRVVNGRWRWSSGGALSQRGFPDEDMEGGAALKSFARLDHALIAIPERRLAVDAGVSGQLARMFAEGYGAFSKLEGSLAGRWFPQGRGEDYETAGRLRAGKTLGAVPFDELFMLGIERDNDLWMRAHPGTEDGRKGAAPLGRDYVLANWEINKVLYRGGLFTVALAPFIDSGRVYHHAPGLGSEKWLWDVGLQAKLSLVGRLGFVLSYGRDLRTGRGAFYAWAR